MLKLYKVIVCCVLKLWLDAFLVTCNLHLAYVGVLNGGFSYLFLSCCRVDHIYLNQVMFYEYYISYSFYINKLGEGYLPII
jgi:hypothetical protein